MIRKEIERRLRNLLEKAVHEGLIRSTEIPRFTVEPPRQKNFGDYATNIALVLAGREKKSPREVAAWFAERLRPDPLFARIEVAGPGFINFFISSGYWQKTVARILSLGPDYGRVDLGRGRRVLLEFVSANPTGPLHVGHGRGAAVGDCLANILEMAGFSVEREYYINDVGKQMDTLGASVYLRYRELLGEEIEFPEDFYKGDYIREIAREILEQYGDKFRHQKLEEALPFFRKYALSVILEEIRGDLKDFGVHYDRWFSEASLYEKSQVDKTIEALKASGYIYEKEGALWFRSSAFGDEKDRVVVRANGQTTYFASDIAYHRHKLERGYDLLVDIWGADHHGYVPRVKAAISALGYDPGRLEVLLVQFVNLIEEGELKSMSTRRGEFVPLREVLEEVGRDAVRFIFLTRHCNSHLDFDLSLAKKQSQENPVYYVQYAHARVASVFEKATEKGVVFHPLEEIDLSLLKEEEELELLKLLDAFPDVIEGAAESLEPHRLTFYLTEVATVFHNYYTKHRFLSEDEELSRARLALALATKQVIGRGLGLLGVSAPEKM
ncbi:arginine--tRNA ligase [Thermosulfuriphilus sp.]